MPDQEAAAASLRAPATLAEPVGLDRAIRVAAVLIALSLGERAVIVGAAAAITLDAHQLAALADVDDRRCVAVAPREDGHAHADRGERPYLSRRNVIDEGSGFGAELHFKSPFEEVAGRSVPLPAGQVNRKDAAKINGLEDFSRKPLARSGSRCR